MDQATKAFKGVPFFRAVPTAYLKKVLARHAAENLQHFKADEVIVEFVGAQQFSATSLAADAARPLHQISAKIQVDVPKTVEFEALESTDVIGGAK